MSIRSMPTVTLPSRGIHMNFHAFGSGPELVVLVNGFMMTYHGWSAQIEFFMRKENADKYTVLVFDNRGVGRSSPISGPCNVSTLALDVLALLDDLEWARFHLVGISMGGMISLEMAARAPSRLKSLMLINTHGGGLGAIPPVIGLATVMKSTLNPTDQSIGDRNNFGDAVFNDPAARKRLNAAAMESWLRLRDIPRNLEVGAMLPQVPESSGPRPSKMPLSTFLVQGVGTVTHYLSYARLHTIRDSRIPTTIVVSSDDALVRPSNSHKLYEGLAAPWVRMHEFVHGGHAIIMEAVEELNMLLLEHLQSARTDIATSPNRAEGFRWPDIKSKTTLTSSVGLTTITMHSKL